MEEGGRRRKEEEGADTTLKTKTQHVHVGKNALLVKGRRNLWSVEDCCDRCGVADPDSSGTSERFLTMNPNKRRGFFWSTQVQGVNVSAWSSQCRGHPPHKRAKACQTRAALNQTVLLSLTELKVSCPMSLQTRFSPWCATWPPGQHGGRYAQLP